MKNLTIKIRNKTSSFMYTKFFRHLLFMVEPDKIHKHFIKIGKILGSNLLTRSFVYIFFDYKNPKLNQNILGIKFSNPVGLAGGFDKNAETIDIMDRVGFGFMEIGSITAKPCSGNSGLRVLRLKKSKALLVNYGLNNKGADKIHKKLSDTKNRIPIGINIAMTNTEKNCVLERGVSDYLYSYKKFRNVGNYFTINISCPNSYGWKNFTNPEYLDILLKNIFEIKKSKPVFIKLSSDLELSEIDNIIKICDKYPVDGFVISNLTKNRNNRKIIEKNIPETGGISGIPVKDLSNKLIKYVYKKTKGKYIIIGCGGIFSAKDAYEKIRNGASLVQLFTGMIYEGPMLISEINRGLAEILRKNGFKNISDAIGINVK